MQNETTGVEVESVDELSEGDSVTVIVDTHANVESTGTEHKIPDVELEDDCVRVAGAVIDDISTGGLAGETLVSIEEDGVISQDSIPLWIEENGVTVIRHEN